MVDESGGFYGYFNVGWQGRGSGVPIIKAIAEAYEYLDGDLDALRDALCD